MTPPPNRRLIQTLSYWHVPVELAASAVKENEQHSNKVEMAWLCD